MKITEEYQARFEKILDQMQQHVEMWIPDEEINVKDALWEFLYELHIRTNNLVTTNAMVCIESKDYSFMKPVPEIIEQVKEVEEIE